MPPTTDDTQVETLPGTVIVVGAGGFIGRNLVWRLRGEIERLLPVTRSGAMIDGFRAWRLADLASADLDADTVLIDLAAHRYDAGRFAAAQPEILVRNAALAGELYEFCARKGIREVRQASSIAVYPAGSACDDRVALDLNGEPQPGEAMYAWSKRIGEIHAGLFARQCGINTISFRLTNPYGPFDSLDEARAHVVPAFVLRALQSRGPFAIRGNPRSSRDFIYVGDVCDVICRSLRRRGQTGAYNLGSGRNVGIAELARTVLRLVGRDADIVATGDAVSSVADRGCPNDRVRAEFGIDRFATLEKGLVPTIAWYRDAVGC